MFNREKIIEMLTAENFFIDTFILDAFIKSWKIDPIYEDEQGVEFFDAETLDKIRDGLHGKSHKTSDDEPEQEAQQKQEPQSVDESNKEEQPEVSLPEVESEHILEPESEPEQPAEPVQTAEPESETAKEPKLQKTEAEEFKKELKQELKEQISKELNELFAGTVAQGLVKKQEPPEKVEEIQKIEEVQKPEETEDIIEIIEDETEDDSDEEEFNFPQEEETPAPKPTIKSMAKKVEEITTEIIPEKEPEEEKFDILKYKETPPSYDKSVTVDISNQTLSVLAGALAQKITFEVSQYFKNADFLETALKTGEFKKDNEILAEKINDILNDNKALIRKLQELDVENKKYIKVVGNIYVKK